MFRLMFCVLIALLLALVTKVALRKPTRHRPPSPEAPEASATNDTETLKPAEGIPAPAAGLTGPGRLVFEEATADFGRLTEKRRTHSATVLPERGGTTLRIVDLKGRADARSPKCQSGSGGPGEEGELTVTFDPSGEGEQLKYVNIVTDQPEPHNFLRLTVKANVVGLVRAVPKIWPPTLINRSNVRRPVSSNSVTLGAGPSRSSPLPQR